MSPFYIAVDPGSAGGIAWVENGEVKACKMPATDAGLLELLRGIVRTDIAIDGQTLRKTLAAIELVGGFIKPPKVVIDRETVSGVPEAYLEGGQPGSAMFKFGESAGLVRGMLLALGATVEMVPPKRWQEPLFIRKGKMEKAAWKRLLRDTAQRKFPGLRVTLNTADALLILAYKCPEIVLRGVTHLPGPEKPAGGHPRKKTAANNAPPDCPHTDSGVCVECQRQLDAEDALPNGFRILKDGTTESGDLVWNKERKKWEPVDFINEYVSEYIAVCRAFECIPFTPENRPENCTLHVAKFKGENWVFRKTVAGKTFLHRKATIDDLRTLPVL